MCVSLRYMSIKRLHNAYFGLKYAWIPCGKCSECRSSQHDAWTFRLMAECDYRKNHGWQIGFFTLTYKDSQLPMSPLVNKENGAIELVPHFWKPDVQELILKVRKKLYKWHSQACKVSGKKVKDCPFVAPKWLVASEFGGKTARPHYHGLCLIPPSIDPWKVHYLIKRFWRKRGFIIPKDFEGGPMNNPFVCSNWKNAAWYAAKYCCKDLGHEALIANYEVPHDDLQKYGYHVINLHAGDDRKFWRNARSFHVQSRSLGACLLDGKNDNQLIGLLANGYSFVGDKSVRPLPIYYKNKLYYSPDYTYAPDGKRLVRRKATDFVKRNYRALFDIKSRFYANLFNKMRKDSFWLSLGYDLAVARSLSDYVPKVDSDYLGKWYVAYYGVPHSERYTSDMAIQWLSRETHHKYSAFSSHADFSVFDSALTELMVSLDNSERDLKRLEDEFQLQSVKHQHLKE